MQHQVDQDHQVRLYQVKKENNKAGKEDEEIKRLKIEKKKTPYHNKTLEDNVIRRKVDMPKSRRPLATLASQIFALKEGKRGRNNEKRKRMLAKRAKTCS